MITDQELLGFARQALNMLKTDYDQNGEAGFLLALYFKQEGVGLRRMRKVEQMFRGRFGQDWLNDDDSKAAVFATLRLLNVFLPPDAVIIVTPANMFRPTPKMKALPEERQSEIMRDGGHNRQRRNQLVAEGYLRLVDSFSALAQSAERGCVCVQEFDRGAFIGQPDVFYFPQSELEGRLKMFGVSEVKDEDLTVEKRQDTSV